MWPAKFRVATERRYLPKRGVPPFAVVALCGMSVGHQKIHAGDRVTVREIIEQRDRDGWQKVGYVVAVKGVKAAVPATKFQTENGDCPNQSDLGTYMVDWTYDGEAPYTVKGK